MKYSFHKVLLAMAAGLFWAGCGTTGANRVARLNGVDSYIRVADAKELRLAGGDFTLAAWIHLNRFGDTNCPIMAKRGSESMSGWTWYIAGEAWPALARKMMFHLSQGDNPFAVSNATFEPGRWYHVALVYTAANQTGMFYVNGKPDARTAGLTPPNAEAKTDLHLGRDSSYARYFVDGMLDDVAIFQRALTPQEIAATAARGLSGKEPGLIALWNFDARSAADASAGRHHGVFLPETSPPPPPPATP